MNIPEDFFLEEVRDGFLVSSRMKRYWASQIEVLEEIKRVCNILDIKYFAQWGTLLGAVRHKGYIPWDDDLDIGMVRDEWFRFMEEAPAYLEDWFELKHLYNDPQQNNCLARLINNRHMCFDYDFLERFHYSPYSAGVDIFPLDFIPDDKEEEAKMVELSNLLYRSAYAVPEEGPYTEEHIKLVKDLVDLTGVDIDWNNSLFHEMKKLCDISFSQCTGDKASYVSHMIDLQCGVDKRIRKEYYEDLIEVPFEYTTMSIPREYDYVLNKLYGADYMVPKNVRGGHDYPVYKEQEYGLKEVLDREFGTDISYEELQKLIDMKTFGE